jgi:hypothetical protein
VSEATRFKARFNDITWYRRNVPCSKQNAPLPPDIFFADYDDGTFHPAETTRFLLTSHLPTVMEGGVLCFGSREAAERVQEHDDEVITDWLGYRTARGQPDRVLEVVIGSGGVSPERIEVNRDELVVWKVRGADPDGELAFSIKGYPELGTIRLPQEGEEVSFRILASRPGSGFPIIEAESGEVLGVMNVRGAHTQDEREQ